MSYPKLNFPAVRLRAMKKDGTDYVWDSMRGCWLLLTPEEWVRRHVLGYLTEHVGVDTVNIVQEYPVSVEGMPQRADAVVMGCGGKPLMLVECKASDVGIGAPVLDQAMRYNNVVGARYLMLTNGMKHYFYVTYDGIKYTPLDSVPDLNDTVF